MINAINIALTGLQANSKKIEVGASNIANLNSSGSLDKNNPQQPYKTQITIQKSDALGGVNVNISEKNQPFVQAYSPDSLFADENGLIAVPNTDLAEEITYIKMAELNYKASIAMIETATEMEKDFLTIFDKEV